MEIKPIIETTVPKPQIVTESLEKVHRRTSRKMQVFLLVGPIAGIIFSVFAYAIVNFVMSQNGGSSGIAITIINTILFIVGALSTSTFIPFLIIGIVILSRDH